MIGGVSYDKVDAEGNLHVSIKQKITPTTPAAALDEGGGAAAAADGSAKTKPTYTTVKRVLEVDNIIVCAGQASLLDLEPPLKAVRGCVLLTSAASYRCLCLLTFTSHLHVMTRTTIVQPVADVRLPFSCYDIADVRLPFACYDTHHHS
jgi:hypothetical protein